MFNTYSYSVVDSSKISSIDNISLDNTYYENILSLVNDTGISKIYVGNKSFVATRELIKKQPIQEYITLYDDAPAINAELKGAITKINDVQINNLEELGIEFSK